MQCLLALELGHSGVLDALQSGADCRQQSHAAASTSEAHSSSSSVQGRPLLELPGAPPEARAQRQRARLHAQRAVQHLQEACGAAPLQHPGLYAELASMLSLQGEAALEAELAALLAQQASPGQRAGGGSSGGACGALEQLLFPCSPAESAQQLQAQADALAAAGARGAAAGLQRLQRASLHAAAAEAAATAGEMVVALYNASEAHRLLAATFAGEEAPPPSSAGSSLDPVPGWWQVAAAYLASLVQLGQLFEAAGLPDEASQALKQGAELVRRHAARPA